MNVVNLFELARPIGILVNLIKNKMSYPLLHSLIGQGDQRMSGKIGMVGRCIQPLVLIIMGEYILLHHRRLAHSPGAHQSHEAIIPNDAVIHITTELNGCIGKFLLHISNKLQINHNK